MRNQLLLLLILLALLQLLACSDGSSNSNQNSQTNNLTSSTAAETQNAAAAPATNCPRPATVDLVSATFYQDKADSLVYSWSGVSEALSYDFRFYLNGKTAFSQTGITGTSIDFNLGIPAGDTLYAEVISNCAGGVKSNAKASLSATYYNSIAVTDIIFLAKPTDSVNDICAKNCQRIKFTGNSILNTDGTPIVLSNTSSQVYFMDFNMVQQCIKCTGGTASQKVNPTVFNACLADPTNNFYLYDPGQYRICP